MSRASEAQAAIEDTIREHHQAAQFNLHRLLEWMTLLAGTSPANLEKVERAKAAVDGCTFRSAQPPTPVELRHSDVIPASDIVTYEERQRSAS